MALLIFANKKKYPNRIKNIFFILFVLDGRGKSNQTEV